MRDLDQKSQDLWKKIDKASADYLNKVRHMSPEKRTNQLNQIESMFSKSREYGDGKVTIAMQTYEMVDKHIRKLDAELARFEADIKGDKAGRSLKDSPEDKAQPAGKKKGDNKKKRKNTKEEFEDEIPKKKKKKEPMLRRTRRSCRRPCRPSRRWRRTPVMCLTCPWTPMSPLTAYATSWCPMAR